MNIQCWQEKWWVSQVPLCFSTEGTTGWLCDLCYQKNYPCHVYPEIQAPTAQSRDKSFYKEWPFFLKEIIQSYLGCFLHYNFFQSTFPFVFLFFFPAYVLSTHQSLFSTESFCSTPSMRFLKHCSKTCCLLPGWLFIKVALSSLKYCDKETENFRNVIWKFKASYSPAPGAFLNKSFTGCPLWQELGKLQADLGVLSCTSFSPTSQL